MATVDTQTPNSTLAAEADPPDMDRQQATSLASLPIIDLSTTPFGWYDWCYTCQWNGEPGLIFSMPFSVTGYTGGCDRCRIIEYLLPVAARDDEKAATKCVQPTVKGLGSASGIQVDFNGYCNMTFGIFISSNTPQSAIDLFSIPRRHITQDDHLSQASYEWAKRRIAECVHSHQRCRSQGDGSFLPTRLVNLQPDGGGSSLRLDDQGSIPARSRYIALSYCWGDYKPACMTTSETLEQQMKSIPWDTLPTTFQDAARFALSLGINYLWIDSICIIQGDRKDWQREAGKMNEIYKNSHVTFAALFGTDPTSGLRTASMRQNSTPFAQLRIDQDTHTLYARRSHHLGGVQEDADDRDRELRLRCPLLSRAWAYQERIVSPRVMFFTEDELVYQCLSDMGCECGATNEAPDGCMPTRKTDIFLKTRKQSASDTDDGRAAEGHQSIGPNQFSQMSRSSSADGRGVSAPNFHSLKVASTWRNKVVAEYSQLRITKRTDRLPALAAIAEQFQSVRQGEDYLAGLWSGSLLRDLLWYTGRWLDHTGQSSEGGEKPQRSAGFPTWSWASIQHRSVEYHSNLQFDNLVPEATIVEAWCRYAGDSAFGVCEIERSKLVLRGRILRCKLEWIPLRWRCEIHYGESWVQPGYEDRYGDWFVTDSIYMDENIGVGPSRTEISQEFYILHLLSKEQSAEELAKELAEELTQERAKDRAEEWAEWAEESEKGWEKESEREIDKEMSWFFLVLRPDCQEDHVYTRAGYFEWSLRPYPYHHRLHPRGAWPPDSFPRIFKERSTLATCEIR